MIGNALQVIRFLAGQKPDIEWEIKKHRRKRSLSQNSYYWQLVSQIADAARVPKEQVHNEMLRSYGQLDRVVGKLVTVPIPDTEEAEQEVLRSMKYHIRPTSQVRAGDKGELYRTYVFLKGSHELNTEEMSILLDGTVHEAQNMGIETLKPAELEAMKLAEHSSVKRT